MIYNALLAPREHPPSLLEVKRALLSFDKAYLVSPSDRDLFPPNAFMLALGMPPIMGFPGADVRPIGKVPSYDDTFERLEERLRPVIEQGLVEVVATYDQTATQRLTIGAVPIGGYPLHPQAVLWLYRTAAADQDNLRKVLDPGLLADLGDESLLPVLGRKGVADGSINNIPGLPLIDQDLPSENVREPLTIIARSRIAMAIKTIGYCEAKALVPLFTSPGYCNFAAKLIQNTGSILSAFGHQQPEPFWLQLNRVLQAVHNELIDDSVLDALPIEEVLKLRTKAWGRQAEAREKLFESIQQLAEETLSESKRNEAIEKLIKGYKKMAEDLERERKALTYKIVFETASPIIGALSSAGVLSQLASPLGAGLTLIAGIVWSGQQAAKYGPELLKWRDKRNEYAKSAGFAFTQFASKIINN